MPPRLGRVERLAIELRHMDCEDAAGGPDGYRCTRERSWGIADFLRDGYRANARRILRIVDGLKADDLEEPAGSASGSVVPTV